MSIHDIKRKGLETLLGEPSDKSLNGLEKEVYVNSGIEDGAFNDVVKAFFEDLNSISGYTYNETIIYSMRLSLIDAGLDSLGSANDVEYKFWQAVVDGDITIGRWYTIFDPGYVDLVAPWVASGDFEIEFSLVANDLLDNYAILGDDVSGLSNILYVDSAGALRIRIASGSFAFLAAIDSTNPHNYTVTRVNGSITVKQDGSTIGSPVNYLGTFTVSLLAARTSSLFIFDGIIYNVSLKDLDNPSNSRYYPLDTDSLTVARETLNADGGELWGSPFIVPTPWTDNGDGSFTLDGSLGSASLTTDPTISTSANPVKVKLTATGITSSAIIFGTSGDTYQIAEDGTHEFIAVDCGNVGFRRRFSSSVGTISNISIKETTDALYIDVQSEDKVQELP